jgi:hypothetical protein
MLERKQNQLERMGPGPSGLGIGTADGEEAGMAMVSHGPYAESLPVSGMTVGEIRRRFADRLDIDPQGLAFLDGSQADENTVVQTGQVLIFMNRAGEKGNTAN